MNGVHKWSGSFLLTSFMMMATVSESAAAETTRQFEIAASDLASALRLYGIQSGQQVLYRPELVTGHRAPAVRGRLSSEAALRMLLRNSGLRASRAAGGVVTLHAAPAVVRRTAQASAPSALATAVQEANSPAAAPAEEIVVTARRREELLNRVPVAITAFGSEQIERKNIANITDLTKLTPGLNITGGGSRTNVFITIRGQSRGATGNVSPGVLTYFNEVPMPTLGSMIPTYDMENLQVLKGPQGTLFGRNSIGGAVLAYSKAPTDDWSGYVKGEFGEYENRLIEGAVNVPVVADAVAVRIAGQRANIGGYTKTYVYNPYSFQGATPVPPTLAPSGHDDDEYLVTSLRASLLITPADGIRNVTVFDYTRTRGAAGATFRSFYPQGYQGSAIPIYLRSPPPNATIASLAQCGTSIACDYRLFSAAAAEGGRVTFRATDPWDAVTKVWGISNTTTIDINDDLTVKHIFGYRTNDSYSNTDVDGTFLTVSDTQNHIRMKIVTEELQLAGSLFDDKLKYTVGGFYFRQSPDGLGGSSAVEVNSFFGLSHSTSVSYFTDTSKALYGQLDYALDDLVDGLSVTAGYRQTWDSSGGCVLALTYPSTAPRFVSETASNPIPSEETCRAGTLRAGVNNTATAASSAILPTRDFRKGTYNFSLNWQITPDALVYVATRRGYRAGSYNAPLFDPFLASVQAFAPETLDDVELGTKLRWNSGGMSGSFELAAFRGKDKGYQLPVATSQLVAGTASLACIAEAAASASTAPVCTTAAGAPGKRIPIPSTVTYANAGELTISGFEAAATISPVEGLTLGAGASYVHAKTDSVTIDPALATVLRANGRPIPTDIQLRQQPKWTANGSIYYQYPGDVLGGRLSVNADLRYRSSFPEANDVIAGATSVDGRIALDDIGGTGLDAAVNVVNVFDNEYDYGSASAAIGSTGVRSTLRAAPRTVSMSLRYRWGR